MKTQSLFASLHSGISCASLAAAVFTTASLTSGAIAGLSSPAFPEGRITAGQSIVLANSIVDLDWEAVYPKLLDDIVTPPTYPSATPVAKSKVRVDVRVIAAAVGSVSRPFPVEAKIKTTRSSSWSPLFLGNAKTYDPQVVIWSGELNEGEGIDFSMRFANQTGYNLSDPSTITSWQPWIDTTSTTPRPYNRFMLRNGETVANRTGAFNQVDLHSFLSQYFEEGSCKVKIGPRDYLLLSELSPFAEGNTKTDLQDFVVLVTFTEI